jgi:hypothetical protein
MNDRWSIADVAAGVLALSAGVLTALVDTHSTEVQLPAAMLLLYAGSLGLARPRGAWLWAVLLAMWIPIGGLTHMFGPQAGESDTSPIHVGYLLPFALALVAAYAGAGIAVLSGASRRDKPGAECAPAA